jgi:transcriptional regulator with XRE-family HTH domain
MDKQFFKVVGGFLKEKRLEQNLTQVHVAKKFHCTSQYIANIERGSSLAPWNMLFKIVKIYGVDQQEFLKVLTKAQTDYWKRMMSKSMKSV